jgi:tetratricopeptide (TPR) repeat protein
MIESQRFTNPFPGLRPFETEEYRLFFGREGQSDALITRLQRTRLLAVVGTSGSGKSSLVRAGLLPALCGGMMADAGSGWRIALLRPGSDPFSNLAHSLVEKHVMPEAVGGLPAAEAEAVIEATLRRGSLGLVDVARQARLTKHEKLLVVVDQFEELFRFRAARESTSTDDDASAFVKLLLEAAHQRELSLYVVLTMRSDFLGDCAQFQGLPEAINDGQYLIPRMTRDERRMAITGPVGVARGRVTEPLVSRLLNDVGDNPDQLPILQHALMRTWDYWQYNRRNGEPLGLEHYEAIGTMSDALSRHADEAWSELPDESSRWIAEVLFKALTERGPDNREIRRPTRLSEISKIAEAGIEQVEAVIEVFRNEDRSFLMPPADVSLTPDTIIDISHESLIRNWERLRKWVDEEAQSARTYRRLAEAAVLHREGREGLLTDPALQLALDWRNDHKPNHAWASRYYADFDLAIAFLDASRAQRDAHLAEQEREREAEIERERRELEMTRDFAEKQRRSARRLSWLTTGLAVMFVLALATAGYAMVLRNQARANEKLAQERETVAISQRKKIAETLQKKEEADMARSKAEGGRQEALALQKKALEKALIEEEHTRKEAHRANAQAAIAAVNLTKAEAARNEAIENAKQVVAAGKRGELLRKGMEAYWREEYKDALGFYANLRADLRAALEPDANQAVPKLKPDQARQYRAELGWTQSNIAATYQKEMAFPEAVECYEKALALFESALPKDSNDRILLDTYDGLAHSYHALARSGRSGPGAVVPDKNKKQEDFEKAENFFRLALAFQEKYRPQEAANGHLNLARLYVDTGRFGEAEQNFNSAVKLRRLGKKSSELTNSERTALVASLRELAEFYQGQNNRYNDAIRTINDMIAVQEDVTLGELIDQGQEIANSYSDLGQIHKAMSETAKRYGDSVEGAASADAKKEEVRHKRDADDALRMANLLLRTSFRLRQMKKSQTPPEGSSFVVEVTADLDELGNVYAKLGKFDYAEKIYLEALRQRRDSNNEQWKSYDRLVGFYREKKDDAKADEYKNLLNAATRDNPDLLMQLGELNSADDPDSESANKLSEAEKYYKDALIIYKRQSDWNGENKILFRLSRLYLKQTRLTERLQVQRDRVETLARYFKQLTTKADPLPKDHVNLVYQYLYALNALAYGNKNNAEADATYRQALDAFDYITSNIDDNKVLEFYARTLEDYDSLLKNKLNKEGEATHVREKVHVVRGKLRRLSSSPSPPS